MEINDNWNYENLVLHAEAIKTYYKDIIASFSYFNIKYSNIEKRKLKNKIYSLNIKEWKKDKFWEYLNDYEVLPMLYSYINK